MKIPYKSRLAGTFGIDELKKLNTQALHAVLATAYDNIPYTSLVAYAFDHQEKTFLNKHPKLRDFGKERSTAIIAVDIMICFKVTKFQEVFHYK